MWPKNLVIAAALAGLLCPAAAMADTPAPTPILAQMTRNGYLHFNVSSDCITLTGRRYGSVNSSSRAFGRVEKLKMQVSSGTPSLTYERTTSKERLIVEVTGSQQFRIRRTGLEGSKIVAIDFSQVPGRPTTLALGPEGQQEVYRASGLWQLLITQRPLCHEHLIPVLQLLRRDWKLAEVSEGVEVELLRLAAEGKTPDCRTWAALVEQLADDRFSKREEADRRLRAAGSVVLAYLRQLDFAQLDAEQQQRVRRIIGALSKQTGDDLPKDVAQRLLADRIVWLALLSREDESTRRHAVGQLSALLGEPIAFDPAADQAVRETQIEKLRGRIAERP